MQKAFRLLPCPPECCQECGIKHDPLNPHNAQSMFYQYHFYSEMGRWPTWKDAIAHCKPEIREAWEKALRERNAWTEPKSEVPEVQPIGRGLIGSVTHVPLKQLRRKRAEKRRKRNREAK